MVHKENVCASQSHRLQLKGMYSSVFGCAVRGGKIPKVPCHHVFFVGCVSVLFSAFSVF